MVKFEDLTDSDEEVEPPKKEEPPMDFNDMLKKAAELKTHQLKDKRRFWEAAPEWLKNTMVLNCFCVCSGQYVCLVQARMF